MLYENGYNRVVLDRRQCGAGTQPPVPDLCSAVLCPQFSASSSGASFCTQQCRSQCGAPLATGPLFLTVWSTGESGPTLLDLSYSLLASCSASLPCPAPVPGAGACGGAGTCVQAAGTALPKCACSGGPDAENVWGDVGCDKPLRVLQPGVPLVNQTLPYGQWAFYTFNAGPNLPLQLVLTRDSGDPLLLLKNASSPPVINGVPTLEDYYSSADTLSFTAAGNTAYRMLSSVGADQAAPGRLIAAVYANDRYKVDSSFDLLLSQAPEAACPLACSGMGACVAGRCVCADGFAGQSCEGRIVSLSSAGGKIGPLTLTAGGWLYVSFRMPADVGTGWSFSGDGGSASAMLQLTHSGTHPLLLARASALPTLDTYDWPLSSSGNPITDALVAEAEASWQLPLSPGEIWFFAIYAYPTRVHNTAPCVLSINVAVVTHGSNLAISPSFMSIILGVVLSMFLCLLMSVCKRYGLRWLMHRRHVAMWGDLAAAGMPPPGMGPVRQRPAPPRGLDPAVIASFPSIAYAEGCMRKEDANCSVCLGDYEAGEMLRRLPVCTHCFHKECIDPWLAAHQTCPLCRVSLLPAGAEVEMQDRRRPASAAAQQPRQGAPAQQLAAAVAGPPPPQQMQVSIQGADPRRQRARSEQRPAERGAAGTRRARGTSAAGSERGRLPV